jgi:hypothetical protein
MKRSTCALILFAAAVALTLPSAAFGADTYHFRGKTASASFYDFDPGSCTSTSVWLNAYENRYKSEPGPATGTAWADISIYAWNDCTYQEVCAYGGVQLSNGALQFGGNLSSATLNTTVELADCFTGAPLSASISLTWTGEGELSSSRSNSSYHYPGYRYTSHSQGQYRYTVASGSVTVNGVNVIEGASSYSSLNSTNGGTVVIQN